MTEALIVALVLVILVGIIIAKTAVVVPQQNAYVVERLGKYATTLDAGFHILLPFIDTIRYRHSLKPTRLQEHTERRVFMLTSMCQCRVGPFRIPIHVSGSTPHVAFDGA